MRSIRCPSCRIAILDYVEAHGSTGALCLRCGGLWFEAGALSAAIRAYDSEAIPSRPLAESVEGEAETTENQCPACRQFFSAYELSPQNPLRVEICGGCSSVWLPHGNLDRALAGHRIAQADAAVSSERTWAHWFLQFLTGLPTEFNVEPRSTPVVTFGLILVNALIHFGLPFAFLIPGWRDSSLVLDPGQLGDLGWLVSLLTSQFLHVDAIHLLGNMYFLWILGDNVEDVLGHARFLATYLVAGIAGGIVYSLIAHPPIPAVGASGAISGVLAIYAVLFRRSRLTFMLVFWQFKLSARAYVGIWVAFNVGGWVFDVPGVAWEDHLGGFAFGLVAALAGQRSLLRERPLLRILNGGARTQPN